MATGGGLFSPDEVKYLRTLPAVVRVTEKRITYSDAFKDACVRRYLAGESPVKLFREAGLDPAVIGYKRIERCFARWRAAAMKNGETSTMRTSQIISGEGQAFVSPETGGYAPTVGGVGDVYGETSGPEAAPRAVVFHSRKRDQVDMRDLMIYQQVRRIDELERTIATLQMQLRERDAQRDKSDKNDGGEAGQPAADQPAVSQPSVSQPVSGQTDQSQSDSV